VILLSGAGRAFCSGYDLKEFAEKPRGVSAASQKMPWDPFFDYKNAKYFNDCFMSLFHSYKPTVAKIHGFAVGGGSDMALCCDLILISDDAKIGYPPARVWGCPTTAMWAYRIGIEKAKRMLFTGDLIDGVEAQKMGLCLESHHAELLDARVEQLLERIKTIPQNQLFFQKQVINQVIENTIHSSQRLATLFDGMTRHSPEGVAFQARAEAVGFNTAVKERDQTKLDFTVIQSKL